MLKKGTVVAYGEEPDSYYSCGILLEDWDGISRASVVDVNRTSEIKIVHNACIFWEYEPETQFDSSCGDMKEICTLLLNYKPKDKPIEEYPNRFENLEL